MEKALDQSAELAKLREDYDANLTDLTKLREQVERLRTRLLTAAGDDLCRLTQDEIKELSSGAVKIPPKDEFLASCERFHAQIANEAGVMSNCLTLAQLVAENEKLTEQVERQNACLEEFAKVKLQDKAKIDHQTKCIAAMGETCAKDKKEIEHWKSEVSRYRSELSMHHQKAAGNYWCWQGDGWDHLESLTCPVLIHASDMQAIFKRLDEAVGLLRRWEKKLSGDEFLSIREFTEMHDASAALLAAIDAEAKQGDEG